MIYPPPPTPIEWRVETECGRIFNWSAVDLENLILRMTEKGYRLTFVMELSEYERMIADEQRVLNHEHEKDIDNRPPAVA